MLIAVEGIDGAGKNTIVTAVANTLTEHGLSVARLGFPAYGQTLFAELVDSALHGGLGDTAESAWAMALLFALDRRERREAVVEALEQHDVVIIDRYVASNAAYSWARTGDREIVEWIERTEFGDFELPTPDLQVILATSVEVAAQRARHREATDATRTLDVYETDSSLQDRTLAAYFALAEEQWASPWYRANGDADQLSREILLNIPNNS